MSKLDIIERKLATLFGTMGLLDISNIKVCQFCQHCICCYEFMARCLSSILKSAPDIYDGLLSINFVSGLGGDDTKDLTNKIYELYCNFLSVLYLDTIFDDECKIIFLNSSNVFKLLKQSEECIYKIIRISPFCDKKQTSFMALRFYNMPTQKFSLNENDVEFKYTKSSGAGGQHVNKTMSCVIAKHIKTQIQVRISQERSQSQNKSIALKVLADKVCCSIKQGNIDNLKNVYKNQNKISWGGQFDRIINLHKDKYIKIRNLNNKMHISSISDINLVMIVFNNLFDIK